MQLTRAADYAVRVVIHLAGVPQHARVKLSELAAATGVAESFISKILQSLVRAQLVVSSRGAQGGFALALPSDQVSLLSVIEAIEGPIRLNLCLVSAQACDRQAWCPAHLVWVDAQAAMVNVLGRASIARLVHEAQLRKTAIALASPSDRKQAPIIGPVGIT